MKKIIGITASAIAISCLLCGCGTMSDAEPGDYTRDGVIGFSESDSGLNNKIVHNGSADNNNGTANNSKNNNGVGSDMNRRGTGTTGGLINRQNGSDAVHNDLGVDANTAS